jgi:hypothetical protein
MEIFQILVHSPLMFTVLIIGHYFSISALCSAEFLWSLLIARKSRGSNETPSGKLYQAHRCRPCMFPDATETNRR